ETLGHHLGDGRRQIAHRGDVDAGQVRERLEMVPRDAPRPDDGGLQRRLPVWRPTSATSGPRSMIRAGTPTAVAPGGTSVRTTLDAPIRAPRPMRTPPSTCAYAPKSTSSSITGTGPPSWRFPIVTPWRSVQLAPIRTSACTTTFPK